LILALLPLIALGGILVEDATLGQLHDLLILFLLLDLLMAMAID